MLSRTCKRVAVIEVGSRAVRLLVADVTDGLAEIGSATELTQLAAGLREKGSSLAAAVVKVNSVVPRFVARSYELGASDVVVFGTAAVRVLARQRAGLPFDFPLEVLSAEMESRCSLISALKGCEGQLPVGRPVLTIDLGAGSVEFATGVSLGAGVRLDAYQSVLLGTELLGAEFQKRSRSIPETYKWIAGQLSKQEMPAAFGEAKSIVAMGSAATKLGWLNAVVEQNQGKVIGIYDKKLAHGREVGRGAIGGLLNTASRDAESVRTFLDRRIRDFSEYDAVIPGSMLLDQALVRFGFKTFTASAWGTRHGLAWLVANLSAPGQHVGRP